MYLSTNQVLETNLSGTEDVRYEILNIIDFTSTRKRMSVIARAPDGMLLCVGGASLFWVQTASCLHWWCITMHSQCIHTEFTMHSQWIHNMHT